MRRHPRLRNKFWTLQHQVPTRFQSWFREAVTRRFKSCQTFWEATLRHLPLPKPLCCRRPRLGCPKQLFWLSKRGLRGQTQQVLCMGRFANQAAGRACKWLWQILWIASGQILHWHSTQRILDFHRWQLSSKQSCRQRIAGHQSGRRGARKWWNSLTLIALCLS